MTKFATYYQHMWDSHKEVLNAFLKAHDAYKANQKDFVLKQQFDETGKIARELMHEWDERLCRTMEKGKNGMFSSKVSEKFWNEIKKDFPFVELVGVDVSFR